jgi:hypothetical protein
MARSLESSCISLKRISTAACPKVCRRAVDPEPGGSSRRCADWASVVHPDNKPWDACGNAGSRGVRFLMREA